MLAEVTEVEIDGMRLPARNVELAQKVDGAATIGGVGTYCFAANETVEIMDGNVQTSILLKEAEGKKVKSIDKATGKEVYSIAKNVKTSITRQFAKVLMVGALLTLTPNHALQATNGQWIEAQNLHAGDQLRLANGQMGTVENLSIIDSVATVYSLELENESPYFVGAASVLAAGTCDLKTIYATLSDINVWTNFRGVLKGLTESEKVKILSDLAKITDKVELKNFVNAIASTEGIKAWRILKEGRNASLLNYKAIEQLKNLIKNNKAIAVFGKEDDLAKAITDLSKIWSQSWPGKIEFDEALDLLNSSINKFSAKTGYAESITKSITNPSAGSQDGFWFMLKKMEDLPPQNVKTVDLSFKKDLDGEFTPCIGGAKAGRCFDVELSSGAVRFIEYKSIQFFKLPNGKLSFNISQLKAYLEEITSLSQLEYVFNLSKIPDPKKYMKYIFEENAEEIWAGGLKNNLFKDLVLKDGNIVENIATFKKYLAEIDSNNSLFDFVK